MDVLDNALSEAQRLAKLQIAQRCQRDLFYLCKYILGYEDLTYTTHGDMCQYAQSLITHEAPKVKETSPENTTEHAFSDSYSPGKNFLLLLLPRGTFKSSVVTIGFTLQNVLKDPNMRILIDSETFSKSKAFLAEAKGHLVGNEKFREIFKLLHGVYPDQNRKDDIWTDSQVNIAGRRQTRKEPTISCAGIDVTKTGMHYDLIIMDDLHSEKNVTTKEQIDQVKDHYRLALSLIDPGRPIIVIGTRWDYNDLYQHILDNSKDVFNVLVRRAHNPDGTLFFPERLTEKELDMRKKEQGTYIYSCQYENEPVDNESATFKQSDVVAARVSWQLVKDRPINWYVAVDPSYEGPYSDYAAFVLAGMDHNRELYVKEILRRKMTYGQIIEVIFDWFVKFNPKRIMLETVATQKSIQYELNNEQRRRGTWLPIEEIKSRSKSKEERIRGLAPFYEFRRVYDIAECPQLDVLEYELIHFPKGQHDDVIDALATVLEKAMPPTGRSINEETRHKRSRMIDTSLKPRSPLTGV